MMIWKKIVGRIWRPKTMAVLVAKLLLMNVTSLAAQSQPLQKMNDVMLHPVTYGWQLNLHK